MRVLASLRAVVGATSPGSVAPRQAKQYSRLRIREDAVAQIRIPPAWQDVPSKRCRDEYVQSS